MGIRFPSDNENVLKLNSNSYSTLNILKLLNILNILNILKTTELYTFYRDDCMVCKYYLNKVILSKQAQCIRQYNKFKSFPGLCQCLS